METVEQAIDPGMLLKVEIGDRLAVPAEKLAQAQRIAAMSRSEQDHAAVLIFNQRDPPQDEGAHDRFAQVGFGYHEGSQRRLVDSEDVTVFQRTCGCQASPSAERADFAREIAGTYRGDQVRSVNGIALDRHMAGENDVHWDMALAFPVQNVAGPIRTASPVFVQQANLRFIKHRKNLVPSACSPGADGGRWTGDIARIAHD
jgi:hypothetical protein